MTVRQLLASADSAELTRWQAYRRWQIEQQEQASGTGKNMRGT